MTLPKGIAARTAAALGVVALFGAWIGNVPLAGATTPRSAGSTGAIENGTGAIVHNGVPSRIHLGPDPRMPASPSVTAAEPGTVSSVSARALGRESTSRHETSYTQTVNWSGEAENGNAITSASGSWTVPEVQPSYSLAIVATWVGIGGMTTTAPLIQAGTISAQTTDGTTDYAAWYEMLPSQSYTITLPSTAGGSPAYTTRPGDTMVVSITNLGADIWQIVIQNQTAGWRFERTFRYASTERSAEWITERPAYGNGNDLSFYTLPDYGTTRFTSLKAASSRGALASPTALDAIAMQNTTGEIISAPGPLSTSTGTSFTDHYVTVPTRIYGPTAVSTAAAELTAVFPSTSGKCPVTSETTRSVVLATDQAYPDALASSYLASALGTGTLLTAPTVLTSTLLDTIRDEGITHIYVVGGLFAVPQALVDELEAMDAYACGGASALPATRKLEVTRIGGATAYDTAQMIAETPSVSDVGRLDLSGAYTGTNSDGGEGLYNVTAGNASSTASSAAPMPTAVLVTGNTYQDAESASTLAYADRLPILLTTPGSLSVQAKSAISALGISQVIVMGGPYAVSDAVASALVADGVSVLRIAGVDGTQTAVELAECELGAASTGDGVGWPATGSVAIARGDFYSDGLAGAVVAGGGPARTSPEPLLLTESPATVGPYLEGFLQLVGTTGIDGKTVTRLSIFGGPDAVTKWVANTLSLDLLD